MSNEPTVFDFNGIGISIITDVGGNPWFIANDVCAALGYSNPRDAVSKHVRSHQKAAVTIRDTSSNGVAQNRSTTIINEGGLNRLVLRSKLTAAEELQDWVTDQVLPAIRKTGSYKVRELSRMELIQLAMDAERERLVAVAEKAKLEEQARKNVPKLIAHSLFIESSGLMTLREAGKLLQQHPNIFTKKLREKKVLYILNKNNVPHQEYIERGYFEVKSKLNHEINKTFSQTFVTPKGLDWLKRFLPGGLPDRENN